MCSDSNRSRPLNWAVPHEADEGHQTGAAEKREDDRQSDAVSNLGLRQARRHAAFLCGSLVGCRKRCPVTGPSCCREQSLIIEAPMAPDGVPGLQFPPLGIIGELHVACGLARDRELQR